MASAQINRTRNVLLLGKSGVGKTTTINMLANLTSFEAFDKAKSSNEPIVLIPVNFKITEDGVTETIKMLGIQRAHAANEQMDNPEQSCTQTPRIYSFQYAKNVFNFIDMPGFCDTSGSDQDEIHAQQRINMLTKLPEIHAIVVVVSWNTTRLSEIDNSLNDILKIVPRSAAQNLTFLVTHAEAMNFGAGKDSTVVQELLQGYLDDVNKKYDMSLSVRNNIYYVDYDVFRFLVSYNKSEREKKKYDEKGTAKLKGSWIKTRQGLFDMISKIMNLPIVSTRSVGDISFAQSSLEMIILVLLDVVDEVQAHLSPEGYEKRREEVAKILANKNSVNCSRCKAPNGAPRVCHNICPCPISVAGHPNLKFCVNLKTGRCSQCKCLAGHHYLSPIDIDKVTQTSVARYKTTMTAEFKQIQDTLLLVASFLTEHSIIPYSTSHINRLRLEENNMRQNGEYDEADTLVQKIERYQKAAIEIQSLIDASVKTDTAKKDYKPELAKLLKLKFTGEKIKQAYEEYAKKGQLDVVEPFVFTATYFPDWKTIS